MLKKLTLVIPAHNSRRQTKDLVITCDCCGHKQMGYRMMTDGYSIICKTCYERENKS